MTFFSLRCFQTQLLFLFAYLHFCAFVLLFDWVFVLFVLFGVFMCIFVLFVPFVPCVLFVPFVPFVRGKSFRKKNKKFKTALITSFILLLMVARNIVQLLDKTNEKNFGGPKLGPKLVFLPFSQGCIISCPGSTRASS